MRPSRQSAWAWKWALEELRDAISDFVSGKSLPVAEGPLLDELLWPQLVAISRRRLSVQQHMVTPYKEEISVLEIEEQLKDTDMKGNWHFMGGWCNLDFVVEQLRRARLRGTSVFRVPWPGPDQGSRGSRVGSNYSGDRLLLRASVVYEKALVAYRQIVQEWFLVLTPRLETNVLIPLRVVGVVVPYQNCPGIDGPLVSWYFEPLSPEAASIVDFKVHHREDFQPGNQFFEKQRALLAARRPGAERWIHPRFHSGRLDIFSSHPITDLVYDWLSADLKQIAWVK
jgi:hypothetical protein